MRLSTMLKNSVQHKILDILPDDRPITAIQIVENIKKCPRGFYPVNRTYDQDSDADLRESSIFKSSTSRYLCVSKSEGLPNFVVQELLVLNEKFNPPRGFSLVNRTADSEQKAWRKKQLCYRLANLKDTKAAITDIILCSRLRRAPDGFTLAGELNGLTICYKMGNVQDSHSVHSPSGDMKVTVAPSPGSRVPGNAVYPSLGTDGGDHDYEILKQPSYPPVAPMRPAPKPPTPGGTSSTGTLGAQLNYNALDGVPFILNPKFMTKGTVDRYQYPRIRAKTLQQIIKEYDYPFTVEKQALT